jgi:hypothetical protein
MNRTFIVGADRANPMDTAAIRHRLHIRPTFVHAKDDCTARSPFGEVLAADAMTVGGFGVEKSHLHPASAFLRQDTTEESARQ